MGAIVILEDGTKLGPIKPKWHPHANEWCRLWLEINRFNPGPFGRWDAIVKYKVNFPEHCHEVT